MISPLKPKSLSQMIHPHFGGQDVKNLNSTHLDLFSGEMKPLFNVLQFTIDAFGTGSGNSGSIVTK